MMATSMETTEEYYSAAATVVPFASPLPLLRGPVRAGPAEDPAAGAFVLAFKDPASWRAAYDATVAKIILQCEEGARVGCSISASNKCRPPWWRIFSVQTATEFEEREKCEERELASCMAAAKESCIEYAKKKCLPAFSDARIACSGSLETSELILCEPVGGKASDPIPSPNIADPEATNFRASILLENSDE